MTWIAFFFSIMAIAIATDAESRAARLARRVRELEDALAASGGGPQRGQRT